jgi:inosine-uridine nucleoside N-ribohydrolase
MKNFIVLPLLFLALLSLLACDSKDDDQVEMKPTPLVAEKAANAKSVIWVGDFNNFDDAVALMLLAKDVNYQIKLLVVEDSFNSVAQGANTSYNILEWLGNRDVKIIRGAYFAQDEVRLGANGELSGSALEDGKSAPGQKDYQLPNSQDFTTGQWNLERRNAMGVNLYGQFVPGPWRDNGSTLYNTAHLIPRASQEKYRYRANGSAFNFVLAEEIMLEQLAKETRPVTIINTGKLTTLARFLAKLPDNQVQKIEQVLIMGGGFQGFPPFTADRQAACFGDKTLNLGGNIFSHPSFNCDSDFSTHQEFNIFLDPAAAEQAFANLALKLIPTILVPTNATDDAKVQLATISALKAADATPEACYTAELLTAIRAFEGGDQGGDFALEAVIRLWDIIAALVLLEPGIITKEENQFVMVDQLNPGLAQSATPYDPITFDPTVGKTTFSQVGIGRPPRTIISINTELARKKMIERLRNPKNAAIINLACPKP